MARYARYDFWTHGVNTIVEFPERASLIQHAGWGTLVQQSANAERPDNWFHIAIPSPTILDDDETVFLSYADLRAEVNENARIDRVHFRENEALVHDESISLTAQVVNQRFDLGKRIRGGVVIAVHVDFLTGSPIGEIKFRGAGARFAAGSR